MRVSVVDGSQEPPTRNLFDGLTDIGENTHIKGTKDSNWKEGLEPCLSVQ